MNKKNQLLTALFISGGIVLSNPTFAQSNPVTPATPSIPSTSTPSTTPILSDADLFANVTTAKNVVAQDKQNITANQNAITAANGVFEMRKVEQSTALRAANTATAAVATAQAAVDAANAEIRAYYKTGNTNQTRINYLYSIVAEKQRALEFATQNADNKARDLEAARAKVGEAKREIASLTTNTTTLQNVLLKSEDLLKQAEQAAMPAVNRQNFDKISNWAHGDVLDAWQAGYKGQGATIHVIDSMATSGSNLANASTGNLIKGEAQVAANHGVWTKKITSFIAPEATIVEINHLNNAINSNPLAVPTGSGLHVYNLSFNQQGSLNPMTQSIIDHATTGKALAVVAAGNYSNSRLYGVNTGTITVTNSHGYESALIGNAVGSSAAMPYKEVFASTLGTAPSTTTSIVVGALDRHGTPTNKANMASYSVVAGSNVNVQNRFLVVGVSGMGDLAGTSFAAPQVAGYAAIIGSKFGATATPTNVRDALLNTARTDTIQNYNKAIHGMGEASLSRAIAPAALK